MKNYALLSCLLLLSSLLFAGGNPEELGKVKWLRDFDKGLELSQESGKPVLLLFQEVPGCGTCKGYGHRVLSHPLIVEAMEDLFVPVAIYNNEGGKDAEVLRRYREPSWNNPVVRIVDEKGNNVVDRVSRNYSALGVVEAMVTALENEKREVPAYLSLFQQELGAQSRITKTATFSMHCFWTGEKTYGQIDGVVATEPGFMKGREVVQVEYDPDVVSYEKILKQGKSASCAGKAYCQNAEQIQVAGKVLGESQISSPGSFRPDDEPKYYLSRTAYRFIPMTAIQATKVNARVGQYTPAKDLLSPRQLLLLDYVQAHPDKGWENVIGEDFVSAWERVVEMVN